jgi:hypothetical protein
MAVHESRDVYMVDISAQRSVSDGCSKRACADE